ncbi:hypothetical protein HDV05_001902 [Chytridiales sp. JEL 0842]|nr:hypothetical protein HDV05_001902 [Chytridiales sp. JEL 0842]
MNLFLLTLVLLTTAAQQAVATAEYVQCSAALSRPCPFSFPCVADVDCISGICKFTADDEHGGAVEGYCTSDESVEPEEPEEEQMRVERRAASTGSNYDTVHHNAENHYDTVHDSAENDHDTVHDKPENDYDTVRDKPENDCDADHDASHDSYSGAVEEVYGMDTAWGYRYGKHTLWAGYWVPDDIAKRKWRFKSVNPSHLIYSSGYGISYCVALSDVPQRGCTTGFVGFTTQDGGGAALIIDAYYTRFNGTHPALRKYWRRGDKRHVYTSRLSASFCNTFCADFKRVAREDRERMTKAQTYGNAIFNALPTKQIAAQLQLRLPLSIAAIYDAVVNHGYGSPAGENVRVDLGDTWDPQGIETLIKRAGTPPSKGAKEEEWLRRFLDARAKVLNAEPLWALSQPARVNMYLGPLVGGRLPREMQNYVVNTKLIPPVKSNTVTRVARDGGWPIEYRCFGSGLAAKIL